MDIVINAIVAVVGVIGVGFILSEILKVMEK